MHDREQRDRLRALLTAVRGMWENGRGRRKAGREVVSLAVRYILQSTCAFAEEQERQESGPFEHCSISCRGTSDCPSCTLYFR